MFYSDGRDESASTSTTAEALLPKAAPAPATRCSNAQFRFTLGILACVVIGLAGLVWTASIHFQAVATSEFNLAGKSIYFIVTDRFARSGAAAKDDAFCDLSTPHDWVNAGVDFSQHGYDGILFGPRAAFGGRCGGTFRGISDKISYINGMGFDCIWITPVIRSADYTGYAAEDFFSIDHHLGAPEELKELADSLHAHDMCLIIDVVLNHVRQMSYVWTPSFDADAPVAYIGPSTVFPFNQGKHYHTYGAYDPDFQWFVMNGLPPLQVGASLGNNSVLKQHWEEGLVQCGPEHLELTSCNCFPGNSGRHCPGSNHSLQIEGWFASFADLNQSVPFVREQLVAYLQWLKKEFGNDAFRLDTAIYMPRDFLAEVQEKVGIDIMGEATVNNLTYHASYQGNVLASLLNFPVFYQVPRAFCQMHMFGQFGNYSSQGMFTAEAPNLTRLAAVLETQQHSGLYSSLDLLGNFLDNHDEFSRIGHYCQGDMSRIKNALAWVMLSRGLPIIYYGTEQGLDGHQFDAATRQAYENSTWVQFSSQARVRESLWQTQYNTSTWQYKFIAVLNRVRKKYNITVGEQRLVSASEGSMIFTRTALDGSSAWVFLNNVENARAHKPLSYCPGPPPSNRTHIWVDVISGALANVKDGCLAASDATPKVLVQIDSM